MTLPSRDHIAICLDCVQSQAQWPGRFPSLGRLRASETKRKRFLGSGGGTLPTCRCAALGYLSPLPVLKVRNGGGLRSCQQGGHQLLFRTHLKIVAFVLPICCQLICFFHKYLWNPYYVQKAGQVPRETDLRRPRLGCGAPVRQSNVAING